MNLALLIIIAVLLIALWLSVMAWWWHTEKGDTIPLQSADVIQQWNKATRIARRSWYGTVRYSKQVNAWGNKKVSAAFITIFPRSRPAFTSQDMLTGLQHGPSSYFLASLSGKKKRRTTSKKTVAEKPIEAEPIENNEILQ